LDFFESALAFMAGYGLKAFLIAQSLNQIEKAYGPNNSILDNCHVRVSFSTNDERTAKRVSDALGTATELRAMKNYAGHRLAPWLGHLMISRQETARPLLTPGEVMQLPPTDEIVMVAGIHPIRAKKARYYEDVRFTERILPPPTPVHETTLARDDWSVLPVLAVKSVLDTASTSSDGSSDTEDPTESEKRRQPELSSKLASAPEPVPRDEFDIDNDADEDPAVLARTMSRSMQRIARQADLDPGDGLL
jgi:type IV secretion system protein VirD4